MPFLTLSVKNPTSLDKSLDFEVLPSMLSGISSKEMMVQRFVIENAATPIMYWRENVYSIKMIYNGYEEDTYLTLNGLERIIAGDKTRIYEVDLLINIINNAFTTCVSALDASYFANTGSHLPSTVAPRAIYENDLFNIITLASAYKIQTPPYIRIILNNELFYILKGIPVKEYSVSGNYEGLFELVFNQTTENTYLTNYVKITQEFKTFNSWVDMQNIVILSNLPIESEIILLSGASSNTEQLNILQDYSPVFNSLSEFRTPLVFNAPTSDYRKIACKMDRNNSVRISVYYFSKYLNKYIKFIMPPNSTSSVKLHFT